MELIQVSNAVVVGQEVVQTVNARELHGFLGSSQNFTDWIRGRIAKYGFVKDQDFCLITLGSKTGSGGHNKQEYHVSIDMAKELAMVERNDQGRKARQYFIECEKKLKEVAPSALPSFPEALRLLADQMEKNAQQALQLTTQAVQIEAAAPAVAFVGKYVESEGLKTFRQVAKLLNAPEREFRNFLADRKIMYILNGAWMHKQQHADAGRFASKTGVLPPSDGNSVGKSYERSYFTAKGVEWIAKLWTERTPMLTKPIKAPVRGFGAYQ